MGIAGEWLLWRATLLVPILLSLAVHEWAHAQSASWLGDDTARRLGRLTLNPIAHIDPLGTLVLPLLGVPFGWAKPVPVNPNRFSRSWRMGPALAFVALAGPVSNVLLAGLCAALLALDSRFGVLSVEPALVELMRMGFLINLLLALFNLLPIPPLDGSRIVDGFLPERWRQPWDAFCAHAPVALLVVLVVPLLLGTSFFAWPLAQAQALLLKLMPPAV